MAESANGDASASDDGVPRREFFSSAAMTCGVVASYGTLVVMAGRYLYLYPTGARTKTWVFVTELDGVQKGASLEFEAPTGAKIVIARQAESGTADDFVALSSVCPHLGCQVEWQSHRNRFYCPCHNGVFDPRGKATGGPPAAAGQSLAQYPLKAESGLLFIEVPVEGLGSPEAS